MTAFEDTNEPFVFYNHSGRPIILQKTAICQVTTANEEYKDFCIIAIFNYSISILQGYDYGWIVLENQFLCYFRYSDAIVHQGHVYVASERGVVYVWNPLNTGKYSYTCFIIQL